MPENEIQILIFGDCHIRTRAAAIPPEVLQKIDEIKFSNPNQGISYVCYTGDVDTDERVLDLIQTIGGAAQVKIVKGNMDYSLRHKIPEVETFSIKQNMKEVKIGLIHGHYIHPRGDIDGLTKYAKKLGVNILISGHTHADMVEVSEDRDVLLLNPGSATAAWSFISSNIPSFQLLSLSLSEMISARVDTYMLKDTGFTRNSEMFIFNNEWMKKR